ncbi:MAG: hypothetical protein R6V17_07070 [Halanaerobacter sp.]
MVTAGEYQVHIDKIKLTIEALKKNRAEEMEVKELIKSLKRQIELLEEAQKLDKEAEELAVGADREEEEIADEMHNLQERSKQNQEEMKKLFDALDRKEEKEEGLEILN